MQISNCFIYFFRVAFSGKKSGIESELSPLGYFTLLKIKQQMGMYRYIFNLNVFNEVLIPKLGLPVSRGRRVQAPLDWCRPC